MRRCSPSSGAASTWRFADGADADPGLVEEWVLQIVASSVRRYLDDPVPDTSSFPNALSVSTAAGRYALRWTAATSAVRVVPGEPPTWVELPAQLLPSLLRSRSDLADRRLLRGVTRGSIGRIKISREGAFILLARGSGSWELRAPSTRPVAPGTVDALMRQLMTLRFLPEVEAKPARPARADSGAELVDPPWLVELFEADGTRLAKVELTLRADGRYLGVSGERRGRVPEGDVAALALEDLMALGR